MKNANDDVISRLDKAEERISDLEVRSMETPRTRRRKKKKKEKNQNTLSENFGAISKVVLYI